MKEALQPSYREIRAAYTESTITVYQAYAPEIAESALSAGRFVPPFKMERMTWIKPSFLWMMYRCGWATKPGQERVLAIEITRDGFEWALSHSCLSHFEENTYESPEAFKQCMSKSPVRIQWDPERSLTHGPLNYRSIQIGLSAEAAKDYVSAWTVKISNVTGLVHNIHGLLQSGDLEAVNKLLPRERPYPISGALKKVIGAS